MPVAKLPSGWSHPRGGTSVAGSLACCQVAKARTTPRRWDHHQVLPSTGSLAQATATSVVTVTAPTVSQWATN